MPAENPNLVNQRAFYVAISRARDRAELVTDDAHKLADKLERAAGERRSRRSMRRRNPQLSRPCSGSTRARKGSAIP